MPGIRCAVVVVLLAAASLARSAEPPAPAAANAAAPRLTRWKQQAGAADSATVTRYALSPRVATDSSAAGTRGWTSKTLTRRRVGRDWIQHFLALVPGDMPYFADKRCAPSAPDAFIPQEIAVGVRFGANDSSASASVLSQELCIQLSVDRVPAGSLTMERSRLGVLRLLAEALPDDEAVRRAAADTALVATAGSDVPKLGEYVFVEELPEALHKVPPDYPDDARRRGVQGTVMTQALVGRDGKVRDVKIVKSIPGLDEAAAQAVRQWEFKPALAKGAPVAVWVAIPVKFSLH
jgi:protein TonB